MGRRGRRRTEKSEFSIGRTKRFEGLVRWTPPPPPCRSLPWWLTQIHSTLALRCAGAQRSVADEGMSVARRAEFLHCAHRPDVARFDPDGGIDGTTMAPSDNSIESSDRLLSYLEHRTGRSLRSRQAIDAYVDTSGISRSGAESWLPPIPACALRQGYAYWR